LRANLRDLPVLEQRTSRKPGRLYQPSALARSKWLRRDSKIRWWRSFQMRGWRQCFTRAHMHNSPRASQLVDSHTGANTAEAWILCRASFRWNSYLRWSEIGA